MIIYENVFTVGIWQFLFKFKYIFMKIKNKMVNDFWQIKNYILVDVIYFDLLFRIRNI